MFITLNQHLRLLADEKTRYDALLEKFYALKVSGAADQPPPIKPLERRPADRVSEVIADVSGPDARLRKQLGVYARAAKQSGESEDDVVHKLLNWDDDDQGIAE